MSEKIKAYCDHMGNHGGNVELLVIGEEYESWYTDRDCGIRGVCEGCTRWTEDSVWFSRASDTVAKEGSNPKREYTLQQRVILMDNGTYKVVMCTSL